MSGTQRSATSAGPDADEEPGRLARLAALSIAEFAFVMATGIISTALWLEGAHLVSQVLFDISLVGFVLLCIVHLTRFVRWPTKVLAELTGAEGFAFLAVAAAAEVLSDRFAVSGHYTSAAVFFAAGLAAWLVLGYGVPLGMIANAKRHTTLAPVNGTWFIWIVGTQSVAVGASGLADLNGSHTFEAFAGVFWSIGLVQWLLLSAVEFARLLLRRIRPRESIAPYWVFMGSAAITILAGARLLTLRHQEHLLAPAVVGSLSMVLWSFATWLVPLLLGLGIWRTVKRHRHVEYQTEWWAIVFPVGMYAVASRSLGKVDHAGWMITIGRVDTWIALAVWLGVIAMLLVRRER